ncbi:MAG: protein BatD, partial [Planctomycetes bacterium]|nr:protein BatD [Planctomycetota bacterium]
ILDDPKIPKNAKLYKLDSGLPVYITQTGVIHNKQQCVDVAVSKVLIPKEPGTHALGQTTVSASLAVGRVRSNDPFENMGFFGSRKRYAQFMVSAPSQNLEVRPLPTDEQPAAFSGLVGRYTISATATPLQVDVGQAITLTLGIGGNPFLKPVEWPDLAANAELGSHFSIPPERSAPTMENGVKVFTQTLRANGSDVTRIPPIELSYFDPDSGRYVVARTNPIALEVAHTKTLTSLDIEGQLSSPVNRQIRAIQEGLSANTQDLDALVNQRFTLLGSALSPALAPLWSVPFIALLSSIVIKLATHTNPTKVAQKRRHHAASKAIKQLTAWQTVPKEQQNDYIAAALKQFMGERFDRTSAALTAEDCFLILHSQTEDTTLADQFKSILTQYEASQYARMGLDVDQETVNKAIELIRAIHRQTKQ